MNSVRRSCANLGKKKDYLMPSETQVFVTICILFFEHKLRMVYTKSILVGAGGVGSTHRGSED